MNIKQGEENGFMIIELDGEIDLNTSPDLRSHFQEILGGSAEKVLIDLTSVEFIDSSGIATLVEFMKELDEDDRDLHLVGISDKIMGVFEITKLDKVFSIHASRQDVFAL